jgi:hypothetical protein
MIGASSSSSFPDTSRAPVPYFSFAPGSGIVRSFVDGGQSLQQQQPVSAYDITNNNNMNNNMNHDEKYNNDSSKQQQQLSSSQPMSGTGNGTGWTGRTFDPRSPMSNYRAAILSRSNGNGNTNDNDNANGSATERKRRPRPPPRSSSSGDNGSGNGNGNDGSASVRVLPPFIARNASSAKHLISSHTAFDRKSYCLFVARCCCA